MKLNLVFLENFLSLHNDLNHLMNKIRLFRKKTHLIIQYYCSAIQWALCLDEDFNVPEWVGNHEITEQRCARIEYFCQQSLIFIIKVREAPLDVM